MGRTYQSERAYGADVTAVGNALPEAFNSVGAKIESSDQTSGIVTGSRSVGWASWGERITANVASADAGSTVTVESKLKFGLVDWGRNKKNVDGILDALGSQLG